MPVVPIPAEQTPSLWRRASTTGRTNCRAIVFASRNIRLSSYHKRKGTIGDLSNACSPHGKAASVRTIGSDRGQRVGEAGAPDDRPRLLAWLLPYFNDDGMMYSPQISRRRQRITLDDVEYWLARIPKQP